MNPEAAEYERVLPMENRPLDGDCVIATLGSDSGEDTSSDDDVDDDDAERLLPNRTDLLSTFDDSGAEGSFCV